MNIEDCIKNGWFVFSPFVDRRIIIQPALPSNYYPERVCTPISLFIHEPQEKADDYESTPNWFQNPDAHATTRWYGDNDGDLYQCVPFPCAAIANGLDGMPEPKFNDGGPEFNGRSLNILSDNIEVEGLTATIHQTFNNAQYLGLKDWLVMGYIIWDLPRNVKRTLAHGHVSTQRTDGIYIVEQSGVVQEAVSTVLTMEKDIQELKALTFAGAVRDNGQDQNIWSQAMRINSLEAHTVHPPKK